MLHCRKQPPPSLLFWIEYACRIASSFPMIWRCSRKEFYMPVRILLEARAQLLTLWIGNRSKKKSSSSKILPIHDHNVSTLLFYTSLSRSLADLSCNSIFNLILHQLITDLPSLESQHIGNYIKGSNTS